MLCAVQALSKRGMEFGVERTRALLDKLGSPDKKLKIIHIAGTNGKGSVAEYITQILIAAGKRVGTFTSPAVFDYFEQFRIDGQPIGEEDYEVAFGRALSFADGATQFEVETAGALYAFALAGCEYAVVECGLGGKYDATNAISKKEVAVITSIGLEHTAILGETLKEICGHKAGIINGCSAVVSGCNQPAVLEFFKNLGANIAGKYENLPLFGEAQKYNSGLAVEVGNLLNIDETSIYMGVNRAKLGGRCEVLRAKDGKVYILDGAHNPAAFAPLAELVKSQFGTADVVYGSLADKNIRKNLEIIKTFAGSVTIVPCDSPRNIDMAKLKKECENSGIYAGVCENIPAALNIMQGNVITVCGSFTLLREAKQWIEKRL